MVCVIIQDHYFKQYNAIRKKDVGFFLFQIAILFIFDFIYFLRIRKDVI